MLVGFVVVVGVYTVGAIAFFIYAVIAQLKDQTERLDNKLALAVAFGILWLPFILFEGWNEWRYTSNKDWYRTMWRDLF